VGEIETEDQGLVIRRIHTKLKLKAASEHWDTARRVHGFFADKCPVYRSLKAATTSPPNWCWSRWGIEGGRRGDATLISLR
jgi:uncharacterized OsmC-like protein